MREHGRRAWLQVPIFVAGGLWGALALSTSVRRDVFDDHTIARQRDFAELLSVAIGNADAHDRLARMAATDSVTGLANHRVFHARLREAAADGDRAVPARSASPSSTSTASATSTTCTATSPATRS